MYCMVCIFFLPISFLLCFSLGKGQLPSHFHQILLHLAIFLVGMCTADGEHAVDLIATPSPFRRANGDGNPRPFATRVYAGRAG